MSSGYGGGEPASAQRSGQLRPREQGQSFSHSTLKKHNMERIITAALYLKIGRPYIRERGD
jgi:hypothetical protein